MPHFADSPWERTRLVTIAGALMAIAFVIAFRFVDPAPPRSITMATGSVDGAYHLFASQYQAYLEREGIELVLLPTAGSVENISLLMDDAAEVSIAFVQGGLSSSASREKLMALASVFVEPLWFFYRSELDIERLTDAPGMRIAIGPEGSGTRTVALAFFADNSVDRNDFVTTDQGGNEAVDALIAGDLDAMFLIASPEALPITRLMTAEGISLLEMDRLEAYVRNHPYLSRVTLPEGVMDLGRNIPPHDIDLLAPTANLVARSDLHPAIVGLLLEAADKIHQIPSVFSADPLFPSPRHLDYPLSADAERYFEDGPPYLQRALPFWAATLLDRLKVMILPLIAVVFPLIRMLPPVYRWRMRSRVYRWYRKLRELENDIAKEMDPDKAREFHSRLRKLDKELQGVSVPPSYTEQLYHLRLHIKYVHGEIDRLQSEAAIERGNS